MKKKTLVIGLLVTLMVALTGATFAYWAAGLSGDSANTTQNITVGSGDAVTTTVSLDSASASSALNLVPVGREVALESVSSISFTFEVTWAGTSSALDTAGATGDFSLSAFSFGGLQQDGLTAVQQAELDLFTVSATVNAVSYDLDTLPTVAVTYGDTLTIVVTVEFTNEPADAAQYDLIANAALAVSATFLVDNVVEA